MRVVTVNLTSYESGFVNYKKLKSILQKGFSTEFQQIKKNYTIE